VRKHTLHATPQHAFLVSRSKPKFNALKAQRWCQKLLLPYCWCLACLPASGSPWGGLPRKPLMSSQFRKIPDSIGADCLPCRTLTMRDQDTGILTTTPKDTGGSSTDMAAKNSTSIHDLRPRVATTLTKKKFIQLILTLHIIIMMFLLHIITFLIHE